MKSKKTYLTLILMGAFIVFSSCMILKQKQKPTLFLIGDSTVKNGKGKGDGALWGWGSFIENFFDTEKINIENDALGGTSSRTFQTNGLWDAVLAKVKKGDFVMMQFGHNDSSPLDDTARARGTIKGIGMESKDTFNPIKKKQETVYTYGWYMRKFIKDIKAKGATPIICSSIPRNPVKDGKVILVNDSYAGWAQEVAKAENVDFIPLNQLIKDKYSVSSADQIKSYFTEKDHTHTNEDGAKVNAALVVEGLKLLKKNKLQAYLK
ncbi:rhamnogalacturonan acetylesterase [Pedobacter sp. MC2016-05]|uniref:rhamnogalacturonan acetylesterase n=1 Tax=Pedobacter sp. MC2016-05 TaxID=2994474 RepID=UPI0022475F2E|nr:rhamnogalacturonan acetylesterase [Pedobacter sp. MC2016-05]MCX2476814.1 rhamnogalacturonan acetylesterase [Pedobacter sp. MC2016-05]